MKTVRAVCILLLAAGTVSVCARASAKSSCWVEPSENAGDMRLRIEHGNCVGGEHCGESNIDLRAERFAGITLADLNREDATLEAQVTAEAGSLACRGLVHGGKLLGDYTFTPHPEFAERIRRMGLGEVDPKKLEAYTLFDVQSSWIEGLQHAGVQGITAENVIALRIFKVTPDYVSEMRGLGYTTTDADKLIAMRVHGVDPAQVKEIRAMGYQPSLDDLIQMRIFQVTPDFIRRMQSRGLHDLTIAKLVQIRIFKLAE